MNFSLIPTPTRRVHRWQSTLASLAFVLSGLGVMGLSACDSGGEGDSAGEGGGISDNNGIGAGSGKNKKGEDDKDDKGKKKKKKKNMPDIDLSPGDDNKGKKGKGKSGPNTEKSGELPCEIDFLFVIDNSGSMAGEQESLAASVPEFIKTVQEEIDELEDYHIGVVVTDGRSYVSDTCRKMGALVTRAFGQDASNAKCGPYAAGGNYMTAKDDLDKAFVCAAKPGTSGSGDEKPMEAMMAALSDELDTAACNKGFLRKEALLVVTIITDEEDDHEMGGIGGSMGSKGNPDDWYKALVKAKGGDPRNVVVLGLIGSEESTECNPLLKPNEDVQKEGAQISPRLVELIQKFEKRGFIGDVCADNYGPFFSKAVSVIDVACEDKPPI